MHQLWFTALLNKLFAGPVTALLHAVGVHPHNPEAPISNIVAMEILVFLLLTLLFIVARATLSVEKPGALQHLIEGADGFVKGQSHELIGHGYEPFTSFLVTLGLFILTCNMIGLVPGFEAPTASPVVPLGCALVSFFYYHIHGIRKQGFHYAQHFLGPVLALSPLMLVIEIFSHLARVMSLTIRLFANMFAGDMVTLAFFSLIPIGLPIIFLGLHIGVSFIQTYIFVLLSTVYLAGAVAEEH
ncbi:MAG TPA: F0F1 ATP synthase subunit A [Clostridia bacterium]|nr:F0F1 ATP synthase subunit A [Clostridia bacterium]